MYTETEPDDERSGRGGRPKTADVYECSNCGATVAADEVVCPLCGEVFDSIEASTAQVEAKPPAPRRRGRGRAVAAAALALMVVGVSTWAFLYYKPAPPPGVTPPIIGGFTQSSFSPSSTSHNVSMPAAMNAGDLLIALIANDGNPALTTPNGWTFLFGWDSWSGATSKFSAYAKRADGTEAGTTVDFPTALAVKGAAQVYRITGWNQTGLLTDVIEFSLTGSVDANPDPPALDPTRWDVEKTLWIAAYGADGDDNATAYPANYLGGAYTESDRSATSTSLASAYRIRASAAEDPAPFTIAASSFWISCVIAVRLAA